MPQGWYGYFFEKEKIEQTGEKTLTNIRSDGIIMEEKKGRTKWKELI